ncbi:acyl-CoA transferase [Tepidicella baoligensis]|uniref:acyl-CoA transferase n=1 Tax=Tepidicella baoligensis TaxID=2707016 RepID=UPI0015D9AA82|nr:acyl-CoA transferase [Tepidicella baoligensis]
MSQRENAIGALFSVLGQLSLGTMVKRNAALPERIADHAMAILRDGEMGEPEVSLSPLTYHWQHQVAIELFVANPDAAARDSRMDGLLVELAALIEADRTLAGVVEYAEIGQPKFDELAPEGTSGIKACLLPVVLHYSSAGPLN